MALVALVCPQCGASLNLDDTRDFGFCQFCGTKVMLHETVKVEHSGTIKIDNSGQASNFLIMANNAYAASNYKEAYSYYTKAMEIDTQNVTAVYMRGVCAMYLSTAENLRTQEYLVAAEQAKRALDGSADPVQKEKDILSLETRSIAMQEYWLNKCKPAQPQSQKAEDCLTEYTKLKTASAVAVAVAAALYTEASKEQAIDAAVRHINQYLELKMSYQSGTEIDKKGRAVPVYKKMAIPQALGKEVLANRNSLRNTFNSLPSRVARENDLTAKSDSATEFADSIRAELNEKKSQRRPIFLKSITHRKDTELKSQLEQLDAEIAEIEKRLNAACAVEREANGNLDAFNKTKK